MNKEELNQLITVKDLQIFQEDTLKKFQEMLFYQLHPQKEFHTPKEFGAITGYKYSTIIARCKTGKLKARQDAPNSPWFISVSEVERFRNEAKDNTL